MRRVTIVEIDIPFCQLTYSIAPCQAELGVTGEKKCFNTRRTCQDLENFDPADVTVRFTEPTADLAYDALPNVEAVRITPGVIDPGRSLGERESVDVTFSDHPHADAGPVLFDKYISDRSYVPFEQGTFWGKFRARHTSLKGAALRIKRGELGTALADMDTWHYVIESISGPSGGSFTITAKDALKLADGDRAKAPAISPGFLASAITEGDGSAEIAPASAADEYPASGKVAIGGKEVCAFTRSGTTLSLTRAQSNTEAEAHDADERIQLVLEYDAETAADIIYDLLTTYTRIDATLIPLTDWQDEIDEFIGRLYSAEIAQPTSVHKLVDELIEQVGLVMWTDVRAQQIRLTALRPVSSSADVYDTDRIVRGTYSAKEQPKKRISQAWTYYGLLNPLADLDDEQNYAAAAARIDPDDTELDYDEQPAIHEVFSRWISVGNRAAAERLNELLLVRYSEPPRRFRFDVWTTDDAPKLGRGYRISHWELQTDEGEQTEAPVQATSIEATAERHKVTAEEMLVAGAEGDRTVFIDVDDFNVNLRDRYDELYSAPGPYDEITFIVGENVNIGSNLGPAMQLGNWPEYPAKITLINNGRILGKGGDGGDDSNAGGGLTTIGRSGSTGLNVSQILDPVMVLHLENYGLIGGGGGGGGGVDDSANDGATAAGGGGAGYRFSLGGSGHSDPDGTGGGTFESGGVGDDPAGDGGDLGEDGENMFGVEPGGNPGGDGGFAITGKAEAIVYVVEGDIRGTKP